MLPNIKKPVGNPLLELNYEPAIEALGSQYFNEVEPAEFPKHLLRFRNDPILAKLGLEPSGVTDEHFIEALGKFQGRRRPLVALCYHGYQFGEYNPRLGDGRGFLYGQVRGIDGELYDFGTKGSGTTPYSRTADGRLTLKGGVREVLASEALHALDVRTSRCLSLIETGEPLFRGDEPSPTRSSVMVRFSRSHIRFGTFERLDYLGRGDLIKILLDHVIEQYYPHLQTEKEGYALFYTELVGRTAELCAQWMSVGFCHAVLNTDNMSITGESFDYGPYAFMDRYNPLFTAAYFDHYGRYSYGNQPAICQWNLKMLQAPLEAVLSVADMEVGLATFEEQYSAAYTQRMLSKLGFNQAITPELQELLSLTLKLLKDTEIGYHQFFTELTEHFSPDWQKGPEYIFQDSYLYQAAYSESWRTRYHHLLSQFQESEIVNIIQCLRQHNPKTVLLRPAIEEVWGHITYDDDWEPFNKLVKQLQNPYVY
jgi:serine/tyrosine/threonine adenylyltransferase